MEFTEYSSVQFYVCDRVTDYGAQKNLMKESLQTDMEDILKRLELTVPENSSTQTSQSEFDITSMLGEWTLEVAQPNTENVSRHLIRLNADGTMTLRAEDGSWLDYTYTMDETHFHRRRNVCDLRGQDHPFQRELEKDLGFWRRICSADSDCGHWRSNYISWR